MTVSARIRSFSALLLILSCGSVPALAGHPRDEKTIADERESMRVWAMRNAVIGGQFDLQALKNRLGPAQVVIVTNRNQDIVGHYFPLPHITIFENKRKHSLVVWRPRRVDTL